MKTKSKYVEWLNADVMHAGSRKWISELQFCSDEQTFFEDMIRLYTLQLIDSKHFNDSKMMVDKLSRIKKKNSDLLNTINLHEKELKVMVDGIDALEEEDLYKKKHRQLISEMSTFIKDYRKYKLQLFGLLKTILKEQKQKHLLE